MGATSAPSPWAPTVTVERQTMAVCPGIEVFTLTLNKREDESFRAVEILSSTAHEGLYQVRRPHSLVLFFSSKISFLEPAGWKYGPSLECNTSLS